ncbi:MAG: Asp-tRNA(Asn)/Glu-tRNA(Gln) amidotransferase subunit GatA [candidate division Zixibacteria bacterium]|nr:Asp-tRNA(Asn)/Glu-tRNA(Gln) amidotransferase subunit GatA [candidate division Zixibacteria bacterium]
MEKGEISAQEIVSSLFERIHETNPKINAYITLTEDQAKEAAKKIDQRRSKGEKLGALAGIPVAIKDNICVKGIPATCGSKILSNFVPPYDATVVKKLKEADAIIIGKTNMDEFGMGSSNEHSFYGIAKNPSDLERIPGGSSGGSAVTVASDMTVMALGSDTGGSIRQPASLCGVVGMKPTYGRISRYGLVAFASSLDQIGTLTKDVQDCALLLSVVAHHDSKDSTSLDAEGQDYTRFLKGEVKGIKIGIPKEYFGEGLNSEVKEAVENGIKILEKQGMMVADISLPHTDKAIATYYVLCTAEASSNLSRYDGAKYGYRAKGQFELSDMYKKTRSQGFGTEVKRRVILGTYVLSAGYYDAYYAKAQKVRTIIKEDFDQAFEKVDVLITPTSPTTAFKIGEKIDDPLTMYLSDIYTTSANLTGIPAISIPCGKDSQGLPVGLQIMGKPLSEGLILKVAYALERNL